MARLSKRAANVGASVTLAIDSKAKALKAAGEPVVSYGAGEPDFPTPNYIVESAVEAARDPKNHRYTPAQGLPEFRKAICEKTQRDSGVTYDPKQVLVTNGGKQAVEISFAVLVDPGDEVIVPAPFWTTYPEAIKLADGVPVEVATDESTGFKVTVEQLEAVRTERTKAIVFVSPSNPTGAVYTREEMKAIGGWCLKNGVWVITDEIYEHLVFDDAEFLSMAAVVPELYDTTLVINGVAKTYAMTGWRVGWLLGPQDIIDAALSRHTHVCSNVANVSQRAALTAVAGDLTAVNEMREAFDRRRKTIVEMLNDVPGVTCITPKGAFYAYPNVTGTFGKTFGGRTINSSMDLAEFLLDEVRVATVPGEAFGTPGYLRLAYALGDEDLVEGIERMKKALSD